MGHGMSLHLRTGNASIARHSLIFFDGKAPEEVLSSKSLHTSALFPATTQNAYPETHPYGIWSQKPDVHEVLGVGQDGGVTMKSSSVTSDSFEPRQSNW